MTVVPLVVGDCPTFRLPDRLAGACDSLGQRLGHLFGADDIVGGLTQRRVGIEPGERLLFGVPVGQSALADDDNRFGEPGREVVEEVSPVVPLGAQPLCLACVRRDVRSERPVDRCRRLLWHYCWLSVGTISYDRVDF